MSKLPCKKCPSCGFFHDASVEICTECDKNLKNVPAQIIETGNIPGEVYGDINENIEFYVQKCSACGALNFSTRENTPVKVCCNCHKTRIASTVPEKYFEEGSIALNTSADDAIPQKRQDNFAVEDDDEDSGESAEWQSILKNVRNAISLESSQSQLNMIASTSNDKNAEDYVDDEDDNDDYTDWSGILGNTYESKKSISQAKSTIMFSSLRYGQLSFTVEPNDTPYLLGRSANQSDFLSNDGRVGNEHCYILFKNGFWYVKDNDSANGTAVNSKDIGLGGEHILNNGDKLKLGHKPDSMEFQVTI